MKIMTANQRDIVSFLSRMKDSYTVAEIASARGLSPSSVRTALAALQRYGTVEVKGSSFSGGQTWGLVRVDA